MFLRDFLYSLLINLLLLVSLEKKFTCRELNYFLKVGNKKFNVLENNNLANEATSDVFALETHSIANKESLILLLRVRLKSLFFYISYIVAFTVVLLVAVINTYY